MATGGVRSSGFTIVETMIVLAVTGFLAVTAMLMVSGRQNKTEFQVAITSIKQQLEQTINETANGYYPNRADFNCTAGAAGPVLTQGTNQQGTNNGCVFLGKLVEFGVGPNAAESFATYPIIGNQKSSTGTESASYADAKAILLAPGALTHTSISSVPFVSFPDMSSSYKLQNGLSIKYATYHFSDGTNPKSSGKFGAFAFADQLSSYSYGSDGLNSGSQNLDLFALRSVATWVPASGGAIVDGFDTSGVHNIIESPTLNSVDLCFDSGTTQQSGLINISGKGQLSVTLTISNSKCA